MTTDTLRLCYVSDSLAYFTTRALDKQWGDDWNDAPYEHNAGSPYTHRAGEPYPYRVASVYWAGPWSPPCSNHFNSPWSVEQINKLAVPWLMADEYSNMSADLRTVWAGTTLDEFRWIITTGGGCVSEPHEEATECRG